MGFFTPLTEEDLRQSAVPTNGPLTSPAWTDECIQRSEEHGVGHDFDGGVELDLALFSDDRVSVTVERIAVSSVAISVNLAIEIFSGDRLNPMWPWSLAGENTWSQDWLVETIADSPSDICRFGVRYADGAWVATGTGFRDGEHVFGEADVASHTSPRLRMLLKGGGGSPSSATAGLHLWPPPADDIELKFEWPGLNIVESTVVVPKTILALAGGSTVPWPASSPRIRLSKCASNMLGGVVTEVVVHGENPLVIFRAAGQDVAGLAENDHGAFMFEAKTKGLTITHPVTLIGFEFDGLAGFFSGLADAWRGFTGQRVWRSLERDLTITAWADNLGHCHLEFDVCDGPIPSWRANIGNVTINAGEEMSRLAGSVSEWAKHHRRS